MTACTAEQKARKNTLERERRARRTPKQKARDAARAREQRAQPAQKTRKAASGRAWCEANKERKAASERAWREANKERKAATTRAWQQVNKEHINARRRARREANKEHHLELERAWRQRMTPAQKARKRETGRASYKRNRDRIVAKRRVEREANKEQIAAARRTRAELNLAHSLCSGAKRSAKRLGIPFDLTPADIAVPERCPVFGIPLFMGKGRSGPNSPTADRLVPSKGYVRGNVVVISQYANSRKTNATAAEHYRIAEWMKSMGAL